MPHHSYFLTLSLFFGIACFGQEKNEIDSLKSVVNSSVKIEKKLDAYDALFGLLIYDDASEAFHIVNELDSIAKKENHLPGIVLSNLNLGYYYYVEEVIDSAEFYLNKTLDLSKTNYSEDVVNTALNNLSLVEAHKGNYVASNSILDSLGTIYLKNKNYLRYGVSINNIAANNYDQGNYLEAMEGYQHALKILDTIKEEPFRKADVLRNIGKLNIRQNHLKEALEYFSSALKIYLDVGDNLYAASTYMDIGTVYSDLEDYEKAIEYHKKGLELGEKNNQGSISVLAYGNIGIVYLEMKRFREAIHYLKKGLNQGGSELSDINRTIYLYQIGNSYTNIGSYDIAKKYLDSSVILAQTNKIGNELLNALSYRSFNYELMGDLKNAIADIKESNTLNDSLFTIESAKKIKEIQTIYQTEKKEAEIALQEEEIKTLNEKSRADKLQKGLFAGGMASALALFGLSVFGYRQRIKKNRIAREKQEEIYKQEIGHKQKELASQTLHLVQKNTFIQELKENLENLKNSPEKFKTEFRRIVMLLKKENASDKDWEVFKTYFADVHNDFDQKLKTLYVDISEKEIRLAAFLRMNLTTKEIAATLNVLPDSILKSKYRLKKKLGLDKETDLTAYLNSL